MGKGKEERVDELLEMADLMKEKYAHPYDLTGGQQQIAALVKVLLADPEILLLDEPTKGMDREHSRRFGELLQKLADEGRTIFMVSHDLEFCAKYADLVSMFFDGSIITTNTPNRFFSQNSFYTTAANRMSRHIFENAITNEDVIELCRQNL